MNDEKRLWQYRWFRDVLWLLGGAVLLALVWEVRAVLAPVAIGMALAYVVNPPVNWLSRRWHVPRWLSAAAALVLACLLVAGLTVYVAPKVVGQAVTLADHLPDYCNRLAQQVREWSHAPTPAITPAPEPLDSAHTLGGFPTSRPAATAPAEANPMLSALASVDLGALSQYALRLLGTGSGIVSSVFGLLAYLTMAAILAAVSFFYFTWKWDAILAWFDQFIPPANRPRVLAILGRMDRSVSAWFRGRLIQCAVLSFNLSVGWAMAGVPYWLLLGLLCGVLNLVPYMGAVGCPVAVALVWLDLSGSEQPWSAWAVLIWPTAVYLLSQGFDGWVVEPLVQGKATNLSPLAVMLAVIIGATLAGLLGLVLAIPAMACGKIAFEELVLPRLRPRRPGVRGSEE